MTQVLNSDWTFTEEVPLDRLDATIKDLLIAGEETVAAYKTIRDIAVFTNKRLIVSDAQGFTGKKKEIYSIPYKSVTLWSTENAGTLDFNSEVELWTRAGIIKINLQRGIDVRRFDTLLAEVCL